MARGKAVVVGVAINLLALAIGYGPAAASEVQVVASISPVHALVAGVMAGVGTPTLLVKAGSSPHAYGLRPSAARALDRADVVFWIGEDFETFMAKPLEALAGRAGVVELGHTEGLIRRPARAGGMWAGHVHDEAHQPAPAHGRTDMHIWLDPHNAGAMVDAIVVALSSADAGNAATYQQNGARLRQKLAELDQVLVQKLAPIRDRPFVVFHDAYQYFEQRYGLNAIGSIAVDPERRPGVQRLREIQHHLDELDAACVFAEPQFEPALVATVVEGTPARIGTLDPMGADLEPGPGQYFELLDRLAAAMVDCLMR